MVDCSIGWVAMEAETGRTVRSAVREIEAASRPADGRAGRPIARLTSSAHLALRSDNEVN